MPAKRKNQSCAATRVTLCHENLKVVKQLKAEIEIKHLTNISEVINIIITEWRELKSKQNEKKFAP